MASEFITGITPQADFPYEDLSESNASLLELMLSNKELVASGHALGEGVSWAFRVGHPTIVKGLGRIYDEPRLLEAIDHGVQVFEAASTFVSEQPLVVDEAVVIKNGIGISRAFSKEKLDQYASAALENLSNELPRTKEVVESASKRFFAHLTSYAILGAAMSRQFEVGDSN